MTREGLKKHCEKQMEMCEMWAISRGEKPSGKIYEEHKLILELLEQESTLDKIRAEIVDCLKALDEIEKLGFNIYLPNEMSGRRLTYKQCLEFIDKYKAESEE